jgi:uncharacterized membrane protein
VQPRLTVIDAQGLMHRDRSLHAFSDGDGDEVCIPRCISCDVQPRDSRRSEAVCLDLAFGVELDPELRPRLPLSPGCNAEPAARIRGRGPDALEGLLDPRGQTPGSSSASTTTEPLIPMNRGPLIAAATLLGIGLGGFVDGIVFHQILQLHGMLSAKLPRTSLLHAEVNMFWDGLFHAFTWLMTSVGLAMLWHALGRRDVPHSTRTFVGGLVLGWGVFNSVEGAINHAILGLHHVVENGNHLLWDTVFLASGVILIGLGGLSIGRSNARSDLASMSR